jgi:HK97 family phage portal protein
MKFLNKFIKKSSVVNSELDFATGQYYMQADNSLSPLNLIANNKGYVFACISKICQYLASVPVKVYTYTDSPNSLIVGNKAVTKAFKANIKKNNRIVKKELDTVEITELDHPLYKLIMNPQDGVSYSDWVNLIASYLLVTGNALLEIVKDGEQIKELKVLKWEHIYPYIQDGKVIRYDYTPPNDISQSLKPEQVIHLKQMSAGSLILGKGNLEQCLDSAVLLNYFDQLQINLSKNYAMPGMAITVGTKVSNADEAKKITDDFKRKFGCSNVGKPIVLFGNEIGIQKLNITPTEMQLNETIATHIKKIAATIGVPYDLVDTSNSNRASSITAINSFYQITILPMLNKILEEINSKIVAVYYDENSFYYYDESDVISDDPKEQSIVYNSYLSSGVLTINEVRNKLGLEPLEQVEQVEPLVIDNQADTNTDEGE